MRAQGVNLAGDDQADRTVHGGVDKAIYAYGIEDYAWFERERGIAVRPGLFGENLTTRGVDLGALLVGERWRVGSALLEVSEPRLPCFKFAWRMDDPQWIKTFAKALRPGAYFRIVEAGDVAAGDAAELEFRPEHHGATIREVMRIRLFAPGERAKLANVAALPEDWRRWAAGEERA